MKVVLVPACNMSNCQTMVLLDTETHQKGLCYKQISLSLLLWDSGTERKEKAMNVVSEPACNRSNCWTMGLLDTGWQEKRLCQKHISQSMFLWDTGTDQKQKTMKVVLVPACNRSNCWTMGLLENGTQEKGLCQETLRQTLSLCCVTL